MFEVTPEAQTGASPGDPVQSSALGPVTAAPAPLEVTSISPNEVPRGLTTDVTITGSGFDPGVSVTVENGAGPAPDAWEVIWQDGGTIRAKVTVRSGGPRRDRTWDVRVTNPDGGSVVVPAGLIVTVGG